MDKITKQAAEQLRATLYAVGGTALVENLLITENDIIFPFGITLHVSPVGYQIIQNNTTQSYSCWRSAIRGVVVTYYGSMVDNINLHLC